MSARDPFFLDKSKVRRSFSQVAPHYEEVAVLQHEVSLRLLERLNLLRMTPGRILDLGAGCGRAAHAMSQRYPDSQVVALDLSETMLGQARRSAAGASRPALLCGDIEAIPCVASGFDLLFSNLTLQWCNDVAHVFREFARLLRPGGVVMFTTFGPDTLGELRAAWSQVDDFTHVNGFIDMHIIGDALVDVGLAEPVMDMEMFTLTYPDVSGLMRDLKGMGAHNVTAGRPQGLTGKGTIRALRQEMEKFRVDGVLPVTFEVIYGLAWAPATAQSGAAEVAVDQLAGR